MNTVLKILKAHHIRTKIVEFKKSTHTAQQAATSLKCDVSQIAKSIIFVTSNKEPILVIVCGANRVNLELLGKVLNSTVTIASSAFIKQETGYDVGGVPPFGHKTKLKTFIDRDLLEANKVYTSAGTSNSIFKIGTLELIEITKAQIIQIK